MFLLFSFSRLIIIVFSFALFVYIIYRNSPPKGTSIFCILFALYFYTQYCENVDKVLSASPNLHTYDDIIEDIHWPVEVMLVDFENSMFCIVSVSHSDTIAALLAISSFRSGMPEYVFNAQGILIDSTLDNNADSRYEALWGKLAQVKKITRKEFSLIIQDDMQKWKSRE